MRFKFLAVLALVTMVSACAGTEGTGAAGGGVAPGTQEDLVVNVGDRVFFAFDKYNLDNNARGTLEKQAAWLKTNTGISITIEGHADERGTREYNIALGERRANAVKD